MSRGSNFRPSAYATDHYSRQRFNLPVSRKLKAINRERDLDAYLTAKLNIISLIDKIPNPPTMAGRNPQPVTPTPDAPEPLVARTHPTAKSVQGDLLTLQDIFNSTKVGLTDTINNKFETLRSAVDDVSDTIISRIDGLEKKVTEDSSSFEKRLAAVEQSLRMVTDSDKVILQTDPKVAEAQTVLDDKLSKAVQVMACMEKDIGSNTTRGLLNTAKLLSNNYKISGIPLRPGEDPFEVTVDFLTSKLQIDFQASDLHVAFRLEGTIKVFIKRVRVELPPQMFISCSPSLKQKIDKNKHLLQKEKDPTDGHFYKIKQHLPDAFAAARQHFNPIVEDIIVTNKGKKKHEKVSFMFNGAQLLVDGKPVVEAVQPPPRSSIININQEQQQQLKTFPLEPLHEITDRKSRFIGYALRVYNIISVQQAYLRMRQLHPSA